MEFAGNEQEEIRGKLKWLIVLRAVIVTILLGVSLFLPSAYSPIDRPQIPSSYLIAAAYPLTLLYSYLLPRMRAAVLLATLQIGVDVLLVTYLVSYTGGIESPFSPFYFLIIIAASIILGRRGGRLTAFSASLLFGTLVDLQYFGYISGGNESAGKSALYLLFMNIAAFLAVAYLSGGLAQKLSVAQERLQEKSAGLAELKAFHECVVQSMSSGLFTTGMNGLITSFNRSAEEITGFQEDVVKGRLWWEVFEAEELRHLVSDKHPLLDSVRFDRSFRTWQGDHLSLGMTVSPLRDTEGIQIGGVWMFQDLTHIREMEEEMERRKWLSTIGEMAAGMAHEIRNPLAALSGSMQVLQRGMRLEEDENRRLMEIALKETERLNSIITAFLRYARPAPLNKKPCDIRQVVFETVDLLKNDISHNQGIEMIANLPDGELRASVDADQLRQVFWNLAINAVEAVAPKAAVGAGLLTVGARGMTTYLAKDGVTRHWIEVTLSDNGGGISKNDLPKIFNPFFTTKDRGSGLGLAIVHRIIEEHRGHIYVESRPGAGTQFTVLLPSEEKSTA
ncbi:MAG TPA: ATP-binding protein [Nitrospiria bacterium]